MKVIVEVRVAVAVSVEVIVEVEVVSTGAVSRVEDETLDGAI